MILLLTFNWSFIVFPKEEKRLACRMVLVSILTFAIGAALTLNAASAATRQRSAVIPVELIGLDLELFGLAGTTSGIGMPGVIRMQKAELRTATVTLRVVAVATIPQLLPQQSLSDVRRQRTAWRAIRWFACSKPARILQSIPRYISWTTILWHVNLKIYVISLI